jgi:hypothetical protein
VSTRTEVLRVVAAGALMFALAYRRSERRVVGDLMSASAIGRDSAIELKGLNALRRLAVRRLTAGAAVIELPGEKYYLDTKGLEAYQRGRRRFALLLIGLIVAGFGALWWRGVFR